MLIQGARWLGVVSGLVALLALSGCGGGENHAPIIAAARVEPLVLPGGGGRVTVTASLIDRERKGVDRVYAAVTEEMRAPVEVTLHRISGDAREGEYQGHFDVPANPGPGMVRYEVVVHAVDTRQLAAEPVPAGIVTVASAAAVPNQPPVVSNVGVTPASLPESGGQITITAAAADGDAHPVERVYAEVTQPDGALWRVTLERVSGTAVSGDYRGVFDLPANGEQQALLYQVAVGARDTASAITTPVSAGNVTVAGSSPLNQPPIISQTSLAPVALPSGGGRVTLLATVADAGPDLVEQVTAEIIGPDGGPHPIELARLQGDASNGLYRATVDLPANPGTAVQVYEVVIRARDAAGLEAVAPAGAAVVAGRGGITNQPPVVTQADVRPVNLPVEGGRITISATVVDQDVNGVASVFAEVTQPDGAIRRADLERVSGDAGSGTYEGIFDLSGNGERTAKTYEVAVSARDVAQATAAPRNAGRVVVAGVSAPPPPPRR